MKMKRYVSELRNDICKALNKSLNAGFVTEGIYVEAVKAIQNAWINCDCDFISALEAAGIMISTYESAR